jgi:hypothetical protein
MNCRGQIATGITWFFAMVIIFVVMVIYLAAIILFLTPVKGEVNKPQLSVNNGNIFIKDVGRNSNLIAFIELNKDLIFDWANDERFIPLVEPNPDAEVKLKYDLIKDSFIDFVKEVDAENLEICLKVGEKGMVIDETTLAQNDWRAIPPHLNCQAGAQWTDVYDEIFILSEENKLIQVVYHDKSNF